jgi:uncharacterized membrane protein
MKLQLLMFCLYIAGSACFLAGSLIGLALEMRK